MAIDEGELASRRIIPFDTYERVEDIPRLSKQEAEDYLRSVPSWRLLGEGNRIRRELVVKDFATALNYFARIGAIAEKEGHHPDLHLTRFRQVAVELWTHAASGLTVNDFIMAAKIDRLPVELKNAS